MESLGASPLRAPAPWHRSRSLLGGLTLLAVVLAANAVAYTLDRERSNLEARYQPPQVAWLQRLLWTSDARDTIVTTFGAMASTSTRERTYTSTPLATARTGRPYEFRPATTRPLSQFSLAGQAPPGLSVDPTTGVISGTPQAAGTYPIILSGARGDGTSAQLRFTLFVDDRSLPFGADGLGRDLLRQLIRSARFILVPGTIAVVIAVAGGALFGATAGYREGVARRLLRPFTSMVQTIPALLMAFLVAAAFNYNLYVLMAIVGLVLLPETANGVFERVDAFRRREFVEAARELGMRDRTILWNEIIWHNVRPFLLTRFTQTFVYAILVDVTLTYIGLTVDDAAKLGSILKDGRDAMLAGTTAAPAILSLTALLVVLTGFTLTERGILGRWERAR